MTKWKTINVSREVYLKLIELSSKESIKKGKKVSINEILKKIV